MSFLFFFQKVIKDLVRLYEKIKETHEIDTIVMFDGGSDSLMKGNEQGLGDPLEDSVSVGAASLLTDVKKLLFSVGFGADRYNGVSDFASMRAIAEVTKEGGFYGSMSVERDSIGFKFYKECVKTIYEQQKFRSVLTSLVISAGQGNFGFIIPEDCGNRITREGQVLVWPLMATLFCFDIDVVAKRSLTIEWIKDCKSVMEMRVCLDKGRKSIEIMQEENFPLQVRNVCC